MTHHDESLTVEFVDKLSQLAHSARTLDKGQIHAIPVPDDHTLRVFDLHDTDDEPVRQRGWTVLRSPVSFVTFVKEKLADAGVVSLGPSRLYADADDALVACIFNDDGWRDHGASVSLRLSRPWTEWCGIDGRLMEQDEFAEFLDNHRPDVSSPTGADLLEIVQTLQVHKDAHYSKASRLSNGEVQFTYNESVDGKAGRDQQTVIPSDVVLSIPVFEGAEPVDVPGFFRYKLRAGKLHVGIKLLNPDRIRDAHFEAIVDTVGNEVGLAPLFGEIPNAVSRETLA